MDQIAFVTYRGLPALSTDDQRVLPPLQQLGIATTAAVWDDPALRWQRFDAVVVRSCWDYHHRAAEFGAWLDQIERLHVPLFNAPSIVRWNMDKQYLRDLRDQGIAVPPTLWLDRGATVDLLAALQTHGWRHAVIKPRVSATAHQTWIATAETATADQIKLDRLLQQSGVLIQAFLEEVVAEGEWSLMFFDKQFSHAVIKRPKRGDFRVQNEFGGTADLVEPPAALLADAHAIVASLPDPLLYLRLDGVVQAGRFVVMEAEMIEPALFLGLDDNAPQRFAQAISHLL